jgi:hypothetical protein
MRVSSVERIGAVIVAANLSLISCGEASHTADAPDASAESGGAGGASSSGTGGARETGGAPASGGRGASSSGGNGGASASGGSGGKGPAGTGGDRTENDAGSAMDAAGPIPGGARTDGGALCPGPGWCELENTKLISVCPDPAKYTEIQANEGCGGVINDWSGGAADEKRNRLLIWGGGHRGYFGNELYALDLGVVSMQRLNDPSSIAGVDVNDCTSPEAYGDGRPSSRHTYDGLTVLPDADKLFSLSGAGIPCGYAVQGTWTLSLGSIDTTPNGQAAPWMEMKPDPYPTKASYGVVSAYDPATKAVIVNDTYNLWSYDLTTNHYTLLNDSNATSAHIDYHMTGRVDPKRNLFIVVGGVAASGGGMQVFDLAGSTHAQQDWTNQVTGCDALLSANSPGFAYDAGRDRFVGWAGGNVVYLFDPDAKKCETVTYGGGPKAQENGTFGRFRYFPALGVFAVVNDPDQNAYTLRIAP